MKPVFSDQCRQCPRLATFLDQVKLEYPLYYAKPVPPFGHDNPRLLIVGLAPGMHGANRSGRPFTGDHAGIILYETLHRFGFSNQPTSVSWDDSLELKACRITNAVKCLPPQNKPEPGEISNCNQYLSGELEILRKGAVVLALGQIAHKAVVMAHGLKLKDYAFSHGVKHALLGGLTLYDSYHCSRYNTQTKRLTPLMFDAVFSDIRNYLQRN